MKLINQLKRHQFLLEELVKRDFNRKYKRAVLGVLWSVLAPLLTLLVMKLVFTQFFGRNTPHFTTYLFCGNIVFSYFSDASRGGMSSIMGNAPIFTKVNVPKYLFILSRNIQAFVNFLLTLILFFVFVAIDNLSFTWKFLLLLYPILCMTLFNIGIGLILSALFVFFRDVKYLYDVLLRLLMYMSAIFYNVSRLSVTAQQYFLLNPIYVFILYFRTIVIDSAIPSITVHALILLYTALALGIGSWIYRKYQHRFLYYV